MDEARHLPELLDGLFAQEGVSLEILVADGGSDDGTTLLAENRGAQVIHSPRGRGRQMNAGARRARGAYLLFLHADSQFAGRDLLAKALATVRDAQSSAGTAAGHFRLRFIHRRCGGALLYRYMEEKTALNRPQTINGDQGFLLREDFFRSLGGFDEEFAFLEDQRLAARIHARGRWITLPGTLYTSARRFEAEGMGARYTLMAIIMGLYSIGFWRFFERAPGVYRSQTEAAGGGRLLLTPFLRLTRELVAALPPSERVRTWLRIGRYVRANAWQVFFFLDVAARPLLGPDRYPMLRAHDRLLAPLIHQRLTDIPVTLAVYIWVRGVLTPYYRWRERHVFARSR